VDSFACPHGKYTQQTIAILKEHSFICACTTRQAIARPFEDAMALPRLSIKNWDRDEFKARLAKGLSQREPAMR
jgi:hypothetical protein